ncbi:MAG: polysaccharide deacetylase family protein [Bacteroidia bacterium]|nr:polysaccharide deacetylase family protein [Bacteroidia bacterium]
MIKIKPHSILFDHGIRDYHLEVNSHPAFHKLFFKTTASTIPFDLLGAAFWLISRYEEYLPHKTDANNRFHYSSSLAYQYDFIEQPLVNLWLEELKKQLQQNYPQLKFVQKDYSFLSSIDIDSVYKYKHKGFVRTLAGFISDRSLSKMKERLRIILNRAKDPFDCYDFLIKTNKESGVKAIYFFLLGDYGPNDKNHSASDLRFQSLIKHLGDYSSVGIHPSFGSNNNLRQLKVEISRLSNITHRIIYMSRQHFSMLKFPKTYQDLLQAGIFVDYSMGYTNHNGFRASYCFPYTWYSLDIEAVSALNIHPFCISENTLLSHSGIKKKSLMELAQPIVDEVKKYNGEMISIFHNDNFNDNIRQFYQEFILMAKG